MEMDVAILALVSLNVGLAVSAIGTFSEKVRNAVGFDSVKRARKWLLIFSLGVLVVAMAIFSAS